LKPWKEPDNSIYIARLNWRIQPSNGHLIYPRCQWAVNVRMERRFSPSAIGGPTSFSSRPRLPSCACLSSPDLRFE
jgi:hypothetical protein